MESHSVCFFVVDLVHFAQCFLVRISSSKSLSGFTLPICHLGCIRGTSVVSDTVKHFALEHIISLSAFLSLKFRFFKKKKKNYSVSEICLDLLVMVYFLESEC